MSTEISQNSECSHAAPATVGRPVPAAYLVGLALLASAPLASAQEAPPDGAGKLEEITVTARKTSESLQNIPVSVVAIAGDDLAASGLRTMDQLATPGVVFATYGGTRPFLAIRGAQNRGAGSESPVGVFLDGVYIPGTSQLSHGPVDARRVEVIKGPQGTIYGRNTIGGAINVVTNEPTEAFEGHVSLGTGASINSDRIWNGEAVISGPIVDDKLLGRLVVYKSDRRGFQYDDVSQFRAGGSDTTVARGKLTWLASDDLTVKLMVDHNDDSRPRAAYMQFSPGRVHVLNPVFPVSRFDFGDDIWDFRSEFEPEEDFSLTRGILQAEWETGIGTITAVSSFGKGDVAFLYNNDETQYAISWTVQTEEQKDFSQELRLSGNRGALGYLLGLYYIKEEFDQVSTNFRGVDSQTPGRLQIITSGLTVDANAAFGQLSYEFGNNLTANVGVRWSKDKKNAPIFRTQNGVIQANLQREESWDNTDGSVNLSYKLSEDALLYAGASSGFKSGGFVDPRNLLDPQIPYGPEKVTAYEVGAKIDFLEGRGRFNVAAFYNMYRDLQVTSARQDPLNVGNTIFVTQNAAESNVPGLEIETLFQVTDHLRLSAAYAYLDAKIDDFIYVPGPVSVDINGAPIPRSPKHSFSVGASYNAQVGAGDLRFAIDVDWKDKYVNELETRLDPTGVVANVPVDARALVNLNAVYGWESWEVSAYVRNAFNEEYTVVGLQGAPNTFPFMNPGEPRTYGVGLRYAF